MKMEIPRRCRILILGASGFIGGAFLEASLKVGHIVMGMGRATNAPHGKLYRSGDYGLEHIRETVSEFKPELCLNASGSSRPFASFEAPDDDFFANTVVTAHILETLRRYAPNCKYIGLSSAAVYGGNPDLPWKESIQSFPVSPYGYHKRCAELLAEEYNRLYGMKTLMVRAFSVYGPGLRRQLFWDIYRQTLETSELKLHGTGRETRDFIYIDDAVAGIMWFAGHAAFQGEALNLASGNPTLISTACENLLQHLRWSGRHEFTGKQFPGSPLRMEADMTLGLSLGFRHRVELSVGLRRTAGWLQNTFHDVKA